jgi:hypothetical protein
VELTLAIDLRVTFVVARTEMIGDDLVEELRHALMGVARLLLQGRFHRGRHAPRIHFSLSRHALQSNALWLVNQSAVRKPERAEVANHRGREKRRHLLEYLRNHLEEVRPYSEAETPDL